ncbi:hypothetical protein HNR23_000730 [Nocardiopsis mwathae]|uniref:Uncharacterized protein n=1 Tax=Nocardiopsis mwathae TaxID=1472723 RepID=A0A7W9YEX7_9ACTN|nr:hypothetical protein [Nocardiopsis mwathae]MBB6170670.1 hypothetical protein [Nocardiopsis mwathae]
MVPSSHPEPAAAPAPAGLTRTAVRSGPTAAVALMADIPATGQLGDACARRFDLPDPGRRVFTSRSAALGGGAEFIDFAARRLDDGHKVIAVYPAWRAEPALRAIRFARGALRTDHIAQVPLDLSPLALSLVADQLAHLAPYLPAGLTAAVARELPKHILAGAWLRRVGSLATLPTTIGQHVGSYVPGVAFLAYCSPEAGVRWIRHGADIDELPYRPQAPTQMLYTIPEGLRTSFLDDHLLPVLSPDRSLALPPQPLAADYWGTSAHIEFVSFSAHPRALTAVLTDLASTMCTWCREPVAIPTCPFCGAANRLTRRPPGPPRLSAPVTPRPRIRATGATDDHAPSCSDPTGTPGEPEPQEAPAPPPLPTCPAPDDQQEPVPATLGDRMESIRLRARSSHAPLPSLPERLLNSPHPTPVPSPRTGSDQVIHHRNPPSALPMAPNGRPGSHPLNADSEPPGAYDLPASGESTLARRVTPP